MRGILALAALGLFLTGGPAKADYASTILADGPVAYDRLGEASGFAGVDSSGLPAFSRSRPMVYPDGSVLRRCF